MNAVPLQNFYNEVLMINGTNTAFSRAVVSIVGCHKGIVQSRFIPHNLSFVLLAMGLLCFGWFGLNGANAPTANGVAATAFVAIHLASISAMTIWSCIEWLKLGKLTIHGAASGAIAGLTTITPSAGFVSPNLAILIGLFAGIICYLTVNTKSRLGLDDSLDVVDIHGIGGVTGIILLGIFTAKFVNSGRLEGLLAGNTSQLCIQLIGLFAVAVYAFALSWIIIKMSDALSEVRYREDN